MRTWLYQQLSIVNAPGGVFENTAITHDNIPFNKPFIVYSMGTNSPEVIDGNSTLASSEFITVWVHGNPGDYLPIDALLADIRVVLETSGNIAPFIQANYINTSDDLRDPDMGTVMRFSRYQLIHTAREA